MRLNIFSVCCFHWVFFVFPYKEDIRHLGENGISHAKIPLKCRVLVHIDMRLAKMLLWRCLLELITKRPKKSSKYQKEDDRKTNYLISKCPTGTKANKLQKNFSSLLRHFSK